MKIKTLYDTVKVMSQTFTDRFCVADRVDSLEETDGNSFNLSEPQVSSVMMSVT